MIDPSPSEPIASTSKLRPIYSTPELRLPSFLLESTTWSQDVLKRLRLHQIPILESSHDIHLDEEEPTRSSTTMQSIKETNASPGRSSSEHSFNFDLPRGLNALLFQTHSFLLISTSTYHSLGSQFPIPLDLDLKRLTNLRLWWQEKEEYFRSGMEQRIKHGSTIGTGSN